MNVLAMRSTWAAALLVVVVALAASKVTNGDGWFEDRTEKKVFIQNKLPKKVAILCWSLNVRLFPESAPMVQLWPYARWVAPGRQVMFQPEDYDSVSPSLFKCDIWTPYRNKWCRYTFYDGDKYQYYLACRYRGCRYVLTMDRIEFIGDDKGRSRLEWCT